MKKLYWYTYVYFAVFICLHYNIFAKTTDNPPLILKPTPVKALPVRFKPLPFKPLYLNKVDVYEFDQKAYVFKKNTSALPVLTAQEWQTVSNDPIRFTLMPNKRDAKVGEEIELTLTAELLNISPLLMFTFEELREYTLKVILPKDFIQTGGTYYDFISDKLNPGNPRKTYTIKGRYLAKPAIDDCFEVLRKLNNEVFILKAKQCPLITEVDMASINTVIAADSLKNTRAIAAIDLSKVKFTYTVHTTGRNPEQLPETPSIIYYNCYRWDNYSFSTMLDSVGRSEIIRNGGSDNWEMIQKNGNTILNQYSDCGQGFAGLYSSILASTTSITSTIKIYGSNVCPTPGNAVPIYTKSITYTIDRESTPAHCVSQPVSFTITTNSTNLCPGNSTTLTASNNCAGIITWKKNDVTYGNGGNSLAVSEAGTYKAVCSNPSTTSNSIIISTSTSPSPAAPTVATDKSTLTPGEYASLTANNCSGTVLWTGPNNYAAVGSQISVNKSGNYNAKCQTTCNGTTYYSGLSSTISISTAPLRIDVNKTQIIPGESVTLTAIGCTNGYIKWKINDNLQATSDNPFTFNSSGFYSASCNSWDGTYTSDWVTVFIHQLPANTPTITASKTRAYNNESVTLTATGCTTYYWAIPVRLPDGSYVTPTPYLSSTSGSRTVTGPANYSVSCTNQGPWTNVTVYPSHPGDITISSNKTVANNDEAVQLSANGECPSSAGIQWKIAGVSSWTTRYESKTVYGPGTYEARCIVDDLSYGSWASIRINAPAPGGITITSSKTSAASTELVTLRANGCTGEIVWTLPNNTEVRGSDILYATGPGTYKAKCVRFGLNGEIASIVIQTKPNDAPRFYATQSVAAANQMFQLVAENCPNNYVQWGVPKLDANGNTYYDYANFFTTLIVRGPGTYKVRCNEGNHTDFQDIIVFPSSSDALVIVANKARVLPTESVSLTAFGCPNGIVTWELGTSNVVGVQLNTSGPGTYKARCTGDPTNNGDYAAATILPNGSIVPSLSADKNTACPNEAVTVTASNGSCPTGWPFQWQLVKNDKIDYWLNNRNAIENFGENYGDVFEIVSGNSLSRTGPRVYYVRCLKPDGTWMGEFKDKSFIVEPVFPEYLRASNNGPALMGATGIKVAVTEVPGPNITYTWTGPAGSNFSSNVRNPTIAGLTEAKSGIYTVTVRKTAPVACSVTATTNLVVSGCSDIRIKAIDPITGEETNILSYSTNPAIEFTDLGLEVVSSSGMPINNMNFLWTKPDGTTSTSSQLVVNKKGIYKVKLTVPNTTIGCNVSTTLYKFNFETERWSEKVNTTYSDGTQVTVVPIEYKGDITIRMIDANGNPVTTPKYKTLVSRLLVYKQSNGVKRSVKMHLFPTTAYMQTHTRIKPSDFTGLALFIDEKANTFAGGRKYLNGVAVTNYNTASAVPCEDNPQAEVEVEENAISGRPNRWKRFIFFLKHGFLLACDGGGGSGHISGEVRSSDPPGCGGCDYFYPGPLGLGPGIDFLGGAAIPPVVYPEDQSACTDDVDLMSDVFSSLANNIPQSELVSFNNTTNLYEVKGDFDYFKTIYYLIENELKKQFPANAAKYSSPSNHQLLDAYNNLAAFYNKSSDDYNLSMKKLTGNYTTASCYYTSGIESIETDLKPQINIHISRLDSYRNTFGNSYGLTIFNTINQIIKDKGLSLDDALQYAEDGKSVIVGIKGIDIWNKILLLNPGISIITVSPYVKKIVIGNLEIIYTRFSNDTEDGKITYSSVNNGIASSLDFYFLDDDDNATDRIQLIETPTLSLGFSDFTSYQFQQYLINCGVKQQIYDDPRFAHLSNAEKDKQFYYRSGRIFEKAVIDCFGTSKNNVPFPVGPTNNPKSVIPDLVDVGGIAGTEIRNGQNIKVTYWWTNSIFRDAKVTFQSNQVINYKGNSPANEDQLQGMIEVLSRMNDAHYYEGSRAIADIKIALGLGTPIHKNAAVSGAAVLHIITPAGITLAPEIGIAAAQKNVILVHSESEFNSMTQEFRIKPGKIKNKELLNSQTKTLLNNTALIDNGYTVSGTATIDCYNTK